MTIELKLRRAISGEAFFRTAHSRAILQNDILLASVIMSQRPHISSEAFGRRDILLDDAERAEVFANIFDFYGVLDPSGSVIDLKGSIFEQTNTDPSLLAGQVFAETVFWQSSATTAQLVDRAIKDAAAGKPTKILLDFRVSADRKIAMELRTQQISKGAESPRIFVCGQQVGDRERSVEHYKSKVEELLFAAENSEIGLWFWDLATDTIYSTPKCNELFEIPGYDRLTYEKFLKAVHPDDRQRVAESLEKAHLNGTKYTEEYRVVYSNGTIEWIAAEGKSFLDANGKPEKMTSVVRKITEQRIAAEELSRVYDREKRARDEAVEANRAKDLFLQFVSHELRSPLNAIIGWSKILMTRKVDEETERNALETIERSARIQNKLINDLVDSHRVASGKIRLEFRPINLYEVVKVSFHSHGPTADAKRLKFELEAPEKDITVVGDPGRLQQVFGNLLSNAIKFTPDGGSVLVTLSSGPSGATVTVKDSGRGISRDALPNIFRQFSQGDVESEKNKVGMGLGLSIVNILVGKHRGTVSAESPGLGQGSSFTVTLPLSQERRLDTFEPRKARTQEKPLAGIRILLVEDDEDSREVIELFLEQNGAVIYSSSSAQEAFRSLREFKGNLPDVIISDLAMPDEDGYSLIARIRKLPAEEGGLVPALALSAFASNESKQKALENGFHGYSTKPFEPDHLIPAILSVARVPGS